MGDQDEGVELPAPLGSLPADEEVDDLEAC